MHWHASNSQNFVKDMQCFAVVNFTALESNHTADTGLRSFNHTISPIKMRHSYSLCSKIEFIRNLTYVCLFRSSQSVLINSCTPGIFYGSIFSKCIGVRWRWNYNGDCMIKIFQGTGVVTPSKPPYEQLFTHLYISHC